MNSKFVFSLIILVHFCMHFIIAQEVKLNRKNKISSNEQDAINISCSSKSNYYLVYGSSSIGIFYLKKLIYQEEFHGIISDVVMVEGANNFIVALSKKLILLKKVKSNKYKSQTINLGRDYNKLNLFADSILIGSTNDSIFFLKLKEDSLTEFKRKIFKPTIWKFYIDNSKIFCSSNFNVYSIDINNLDSIIIKKLLNFEENFDALIEIRNGKFVFMKSFNDSTTKLYTYNVNSRIQNILFSTKGLCTLSFNNFLIVDNEIYFLDIHSRLINFHIIPYIKDGNCQLTMIGFTKRSMIIGDYNNNLFLISKKYFQ